MNWKLGAKVAALVGGIALAATPALAQMHGGGGRMGGGFHAAGRTGGSFHSGMSGFRGGGFSGGGFRGGRFFHGGCCGFFGPGFGFWGDPFFWGGLGFVAGYDLAPYYDGYDGPYGDPYYDGPVSAAPAGPPPGYDCSGWRWDAAQNRYVAARVACN